MTQIEVTRKLLSISALISITFIVMLGPALTVASLLMGWEVSTAIHQLTLEAHNMFGNMVPEISVWTAVAADGVITLLGIHMAYLIIQSINTRDEDNLFHQKGWEKQKRDYLANVPVVSIDGEHTYSAWSYFRKVRNTPAIPATATTPAIPRKEYYYGINPLGILTIAYILLFVGAILNFSMLSGSLYYCVFFSFMMIPMLTTIFAQYTYNELGTTSKLTYTIIIESFILALLYAIIAYYIYKYAFAYPYAKLHSDPQWVAAHFADHFPAGKAIKNGLPVKAFADNLVDLWNSSLIIFATRQFMMFLLDIAAGVVLMFSGEASVIGRVAAMAGAVAESSYNAAYTNTLDKNISKYTTPPTTTTTPPRPPAPKPAPKPVEDTTDPDDDDEDYDINPNL